MDLTRAGVMVGDKTDFVMSGQVRTSQGRNDPPPSLLVGVVFFLRGCDVLVPLDSSTHKKNLTSHGTPKNPCSESTRFGIKNESARIDFFLYGSIHLISLDDFPGKIRRMFSEDGEISSRS